LGCPLSKKIWIVCTDVEITDPRTTKLVVFSHTLGNWAVELARRGKQNEKGQEPLTQALWLMGRKRRRINLHLMDTREEIIDSGD